MLELHIEGIVEVLTEDIVQVDMQVAVPVLKEDILEMFHMMYMVKAHMIIQKIR